MRRMPLVPYADGIGKITQVQFGGYMHRSGAQDGAIWDMHNMSSREYPVLAPRRPRWLWRRLDKPNGLYAHDGLFWVDGRDLFYRDKKVGEVEDGRKQFASLGNYVVILPDLCYYNRDTGEFGELAATWSGAVTFSDGQYAGQAAKGCAMISKAGAFPFSAGDAVRISGTAKNDKTIIVREVSDDRMTLTFYENSVEIGDEAAVTVSRDVPELRFICENDNRLWGCDVNTIYASKPGDPFNWNVFDGLSTDSFAVDVGSAGEFTACISYRGYPCFFKENQIYKVYGSKPSDFQAMKSASLGVDAGSDASPAAAGETLFYLSRVGITAYTGGMPQVMSEAFGDTRYSDAVGGSDGERYYVSMRSADGWSLFCYDTERNLWHKEDDTEAVAFAYDHGLWMLSADGRLWLMGNAEEVPVDAVAETQIESRVEFGDFVEGDPNKKGTAKLQIRAELGAGATLAVKMMFDSDGEWRTVAVLKAETKKSYYLPIIPRRSDHFRIAFEGVGEWRVYSLTREHYAGSEL